MTDTIRNPWVIVGIILSFSMVIIFLFSIFSNTTGLDASFIGGSIVSVFFVGWFYTWKTKEVMPETLRKNVAKIWSVIFTAIGLVILTLMFGIISFVGTFMGLEELVALLGPFIFVVGVIAVLLSGLAEYFLTKWILRLSGQSALKK